MGSAILSIPGSGGGEIHMQEYEAHALQMHWGVSIPAACNYHTCMRGRSLNAFHALGWVYTRSSCLI